MNQQPDFSWVFQPDAPAADPVMIAAAAIAALTIMAALCWLRARRT